MASEVTKIRSDIAWSTSDEINIRGRSLPDELLGELTLGDFSFLQLTSRIPSPEESRVYNAILVTLVEHGVTPSALAARLTYAGAPEAMQAAVAAGLCGLGSVFVGSTEGAARLLSEAIPLGSEPPADLDALARSVVEDWVDSGKSLPGFGHPIHKPIDPRTPRLFKIAEETGFAGPYVALVQLVAAHAERLTGKPLQVNATGAIGALACELGFEWKVVRGFGVMARAVGLVGHVLEESEQPIALKVWRRTEEEASRHARPGGEM
ncbi:citryl-CoA lyase [Rhodococcus sp. LB1]|uniref:citryl-CoA lyase n=1 Tax=Rhodococcus sp. LB1 TaxID=1807499 RepID=UPI00077AC30F|nr:citryl-CoA lyase [Rhodococcus sp. LB1]KXX54142.1 citryl-CoA lyase [Rhodococcus sp. LB1]TQC48178.1 citryl-CoA lyase [Rhodococcus sp. WS4]